MKFGIDAKKSGITGYYFFFKFRWTESREKAIKKVIINIQGHPQY